MKRFWQWWHDRYHGNVYLMRSHCFACSDIWWDGLGELEGTNYNLLTRLIGEEDEQCRYTLVKAIRDNIGHIRNAKYWRGSVPLPCLPPVGYRGSLGGTASSTSLEALVVNSQYGDMSPKDESIDYGEKAPPDYLGGFIEKYMCGCSFANDRRLSACGAHESTKGEL